MAKDPRFSASGVNRLLKPAVIVLKSRSPAASIVKSIGVQIIYIMLTLVTGVVAARLLGPSGRGLYTALTTWPILLGTIATSGMSTALTVLIRQAETVHEKGSIAGNAILLGFLLCTLCIIVGVIIIPSSLHYPPPIILLGQIFLLGAYGTAFQLIYRQTFAGIGAYGQCNLLSLSPQFLHLLAIVAIALSVGLTPANVSFSLFATLILTELLQTRPLLTRIRPKFGRASLRKMPAFVSFASRAAGVDLVGALAGFSDRLFLIPIVPSAQLGLYVVALSMSRTLMVVQPAVNSVFLSSMSQRSALDMKDLHDLAFRVALNALALSTAILFLVGRTLIVFAYGPDFADSTVLFKLLLIEASLQCLGGITTQLFMSNNRPGLVSGIFSLSFAVLLLGMIFWVPAYGVFGAAAAALLTSLARLILLIGAIKFSLGMNIPRFYLNRDDLMYIRARLSAN